MRITENRKLALVVCIACALVSVFVFGGIKLKGQYADVTEVFVNGEDERHNMEAYLDRGAEYASDLAYEAMQYLDDDTVINEVLELSEQLSAVNGPGGDRYNVYNSLTDGVEKLFSQLQTAGHAEETAVEMAYYDYQSVRDLIKRDGYYDSASEYNELVDAFPANIIAGIWGVGEADTFGQ